MLDVLDFVNGEMKVKVVGERELTVEGRLDDNRSFRRCFSLPQNTDMDAITSVVSADGILTITAPQKVSFTVPTYEMIQAARCITFGFIMKVDINGQHCVMLLLIPQSNQTKQGTKTMPVQATTDGSTKVMESSSTTTQTSAATSTTAAKQREAQGSEAQRVKEETHLADASSGISGEVQQSSKSFTSSQSESSTASSAALASGTATHGNEKPAKEESQNKSISTQTSCNYQTEIDEQGRRRAALPIMRRGQFFNDSYFEDTWKDYQDAVREVLAKWDDQSAAASDDMTCYRRLRSRDMRDENQAITSAEDSSSYKVSANKRIMRVFS